MVLKVFFLLREVCLQVPESNPVTRREVKKRLPWSVPRKYTYLILLLVTLPRDKVLRCVQRPDFLAGWVLPSTEMKMKQQDRVSLVGWVR